MIIEVLDKSVKRFEVVASICICEVASHIHKHFITLIHIKLLVDPGCKEIGFFVSVEDLEVGVGDSGGIAAEAVIEPEDEGDEAVALVRMGEDLG